LSRETVGRIAGKAGISRTGQPQKLKKLVARLIMTTELPDDFQTWLRVRERGKLTALTERGASVTEIEVSLIEFATYAKGLESPNFSIGALDQCARKKAMVCA
jgi:hypothetical protein